MLATSARCLMASSRSGAAAVTTTAVRGKATLPDLPYDYNALEPVISAEIMQLHHSKHHQTYVNNYNVAQEKLADAVAKGTQTKLWYTYVCYSRCIRESFDFT